MKFHTMYFGYIENIKYMSSPTNRHQPVQKTLNLQVSTASGRPWSARMSTVGPDVKFTVTVTSFDVPIFATDANTVAGDIVFKWETWSGTSVKKPPMLAKLIVLYSSVLSTVTSMVFWSGQTGRGDMRSAMKIGIQINTISTYMYFKALIKKYFVCLLPTLKFWVGSVGKKNILFCSSIFPQKVDPANLLVCTCIP